MSDLLQSIISTNIPLEDPESGLDDPILVRESELNQLVQTRKELTAILQAIDNELTSRVEDGHERDLITGDSSDREFAEEVAELNH